MAAQRRILPLIILLAAQLATGLAHKCYVCAPDSAKEEDIAQLKKYFPDGDEVPPCSSYRPALQPRFLRDCPEAASSGCLTKFEGHSVMRTCAHVSISDCKTANNVQYCYCASQACNSPDRHLAPVVHGGGSSSRLGKEVRGGKEHKEEVDKVERKALGFTSAAHSPPAFASQYPAGHFTDDEDLEEGSADWGDFYYDEYNYGEEVDSMLDDTEDGDSMYEDVTSPPPYLDLGDGRERNEEKMDAWSKHNFRKEQDAADFNDIEIVEEEERLDKGGRGRGLIRNNKEERRRTGGSSSLLPPPISLLLLLVLLFPPLFQSSLGS